MPSTPTLLRSAAAVIAISAASFCARADDDQKATELVQGAHATLAHFGATPGMAPVLEWLPHASGIVVFPRVVSAALIVGGSGANGLLFVRDADTGHWTGPAFYRLVQASVGLQAGVSTAEMLMVINSPGALRSLYAGRLRLGMDASVVVGARGGGIGSAVTADVDAYALARGVIAGIALDGSALEVRSGLNEAWYGTPATPDDILVKRRATNDESKRLAAEIEGLAR